MINNLDRDVTISFSSRVATLPNLLTILRVVLTPVFISLLFYHRFGWALAVFLVAGITDAFDGLLARRLGQESQLGTILDPIADKLLMVASFITLSLPSIGSQPLPRHFPVPFWVTATVICRDFFILAGAAAINMFSGFHGFRPSVPGKINTIIQVLAIGMILVAARFTPLSGYLPTVYTVVVAFAIFSGIHYVFFVTRLMNNKKSSD